MEEDSKDSLGPYGSGRAWLLETKQDPEPLCGAYFQALKSRGFSTDPKGLKEALVVARRPERVPSLDFDRLRRAQAEELAAEEGEYEDEGTYDEDYPHHYEQHPYEGYLVGGSGEMRLSKAWAKALMRHSRMSDSLTTRTWP
mmetsp:Transcript_21820/g.47519  ORF Transcript_21820/g.47519 Transcript_21820/m.47519 type:complete len:142 (+) Transcript_21820:534-959(+)